MKTDEMMRKELQSKNPDLSIRNVFYIDGRVYGVIGNNKKWLGCVILEDNGTYKFVH